VERCLASAFAKPTARSGSCRTRPTRNPWSAAAPIWWGEAPVRCQDIGYTNGQDMGYTLAKTWVTRGRCQYSISAPGRRAAGMPGTGPLRRSSAPARIKALVRKSCFRAAAQRSPRSLFFSARGCGHKMLAFLGFGASPFSAGKAHDDA
jgi:hypothetical protein